MGLEYQVDKTFFFLQCGILILERGRLHFDHRTESEGASFGVLWNCVKVYKETSIYFHADISEYFRQFLKLGVEGF
jgi:hypothetical protein